MNDVVGLRFVAEGEREVIAALGRYAKVNTDIQRATQDSVSAIERMERQVKSLQAGLASGRVGQDNYAESLREIKRQYAALTGGSIQRASAEVERYSRALIEQKAAADQLIQTQQRMETAFSLAMQRHREETAAAQAAQQARDRAKQGYDQLLASIYPNIAAQQQLAAAQRRADAAVREGLTSREQANVVMAQYRANLTNTAAAMLNSETAAGRLRAQMLATANSIAILDGPLGGVASRFSAFGVLIGRTGLAMGGLLVATAALGATLNGAIRQTIQAETAMLSLEGAVRATGGAAGVTALQIESMARAIEAETLAAREGVRQAATQLLSFESVTGAMFERTLRVSQDIAQVFGRDLVAVSFQVAKALENPAQSLASLERAYGALRPGIRQTAIEMHRQGQVAEAMALVMSDLERRFQGAGQEAALGLAGQLDTLSSAFTDLRARIFDIVNGTDRVQSAFSGITYVVVTFTNNLDTLVRVAQAVVLAFAARGAFALGLRAVTAYMAAATAGTALLTTAFTALRTAMLASGVGALAVLFGAALVAVDALVSRVSALDRNLASLRQESQDNIGTATQFVAEMQRLSRVTMDVARANLERARTHQVALRAQAQEMQAQVRASAEFRNLEQQQARLLAAAQRQSEGSFPQSLMPSVLPELSRVQDRMREMMLAAVPPEMEAALNGLLSTITAIEEGIRNAASGFVLLGDGTRAFTSETRQSVDSFLERTELQERELALLQQGLSVQQTRYALEQEAISAESERLLAQARELEASGQMNTETQSLVERLREAAARALALADNLRAARDVADFRTQMDSTLGGMEAQNRSLQVQLDALRQGLSLQEARRRAEVALQEELIRTRYRMREINAAEYIRLVLTLRRLAAERDDLMGDIEVFTSRGGGGGGGSQQTETLESVIAALDERIEREQTLLQLTGQARIEQELYYEITDQLRQLEIPFREENVRPCCASALSGSRPSRTCGSNSVCRSSWPAQ
jgi:hypothetical protein